MLRTITVNGRPKGDTFADCTDHVIEVKASYDRQAFDYIYQHYEHVVWAMHEDGSYLIREGKESWI